MEKDPTLPPIANAGPELGGSSMLEALSGNRGTSRYWEEAISSGKLQKEYVQSSHNSFFYLFFYLNYRGISVVYKCVFVYVC